MRLAFLVGGSGLAVLILAAFSLWLVPTWLTQDPQLTVPVDRQKAMADTRTGVVAFLAVFGAIGGLYYTANSFFLSQKTQKEASIRAQETASHSAETLRLMEKGQITDRYSRAVDMLGNPKPEICIAGIYALGHIMRDSPTYMDAIVDVLSAFVRRRAKRNQDLSPPWPAAEAERDEIKPSFAIQAALTVLAEKRPTSIAPDLRDSDLRGARLRDAQLQNATFRRSYLHKAKLSGANLTDTSFVRADLTEADLTGAMLSNTNLREAKLTAGSLGPEQLAGAAHREQIIWVDRPYPSDPSPDR
jgi:hypothetical protein